eukprot:COSAG01_NODE_13004_length_1650_cov_2.076080_3_plen_368_part_01
MGKSEVAALERILYGDGLTKKRMRGGALNSRQAAALAKRLQNKFGESEARSKLTRLEGNVQSQPEAERNTFLKEQLQRADLPALQADEPANVLTQLLAAVEYDKGDLNKLISALDPPAPTPVPAPAPEEGPADLDTTDDLLQRNAVMTRLLDEIQITRDLLETLPVPQDVFEAVQAGTDDALVDIESKKDEEIEEYIEEQRQVQGELRQTYPPAAQESLSLTPTTTISESKPQTFIRLARAADIPLDDIQTAIEAAQADGATPDVFLEKLVQHATDSDDMGRLQQFIDANYNGGEEFVSSVAAASELFEAVDEEKRRLRSAAAASLAAASPSIPLSLATHSDGLSVSTSSATQTESYDISPDARDISS